MVPHNAGGKPADAGATALRTRRAGTAAAGSMRLSLPRPPARKHDERTGTELATLIIGELNLEDVSPDTVTAATALYGEGFGLDSIDILEIALLISKKYGFELRSDNPDNQQIFSNLGALAAYVAVHRTK
jgi:acyl carrier protein